MGEEEEISKGLRVVQTPGVTVVPQKGEDEKHGTEGKGSSVLAQSHGEAQGQDGVIASETRKGDLAPCLESD